MTREQRRKDRVDKRDDTVGQQRRKQSPASLTEALNATQQNTVPVLPSYGPASSQATRITTAQTLAQMARPQQQTPQQTPQQPYVPPTLPPRAAKPSSKMTAAQTTQQTRQTGASPRMTASGRQSGAEQSLAKAQLVMQDVIADAIPAGKATQVLPLLGDEETIATPSAAATQLVPVQEQSRAVALPARAATPTIFIRGAKKPSSFHTARIVPRRMGPRPFIVQFIVAMMTVMALFTLFTLASPMGKTIASFGAVQAYANAVPWIPTPTPTPKPKPKPAQTYNPPPGANPGQQAIINMIVSVFGGYSQGALNVARCESGYDPNARNPYAIGNSHAEGVFQILYPSTWDGTGYAGYSPYNYWANIHAAYQIFSRDGYSWREWACQP